ncbi:MULTISPECIES: barstar family protein [Gammaproteobacteria]|uniref:barstar family protein n=1 Tax=Gammaproteobacteria TaxID=1236 RepID=UPI001126AC9B|nr:barstar family protein [Pseudomonas sp. Hp2]
MSGGFGLDLSDPAQSGVYSVGEADLDTLAALARDAGLRVLRVDLQGCTDKRTLLARLAAQLDFPPAFGRNWDALSDALRDLSWQPANGYALLLESAATLRASAGADFDTLLDILDEAAIRWRESGIPFAVFMGLQDDP